jgi:hypothetical protein
MPCDPNTCGTGHLSGLPDSLQGDRHWEVATHKAIQLYVLTVRTYVSRVTRISTTLCELPTWHTFN